MKKIRNLLASVFLIGAHCMCLFADAKVDKKENLHRLREQQFVALQIKDLRSKISSMDSQSIVSALRYTEIILMEMKKDSLTMECFESFLNFLMEYRDKICVSEESKSEFDAIYSRVWYYKSIPFSPKLKPKAFLGGIDGYTI